MISIEKISLNWLCCLSAVLGTCLASPSEGTSFDLQGLIDAELALGKKRIVIPPGRYRVTPTKRMHLRLAHLKDVEIVAKGVEMVCTTTTRALTIDDCENLTLSGLVIDYDPLPFTQGKITHISEDRLTHEIDIFDGYPKQGLIRAKKYEIYRPDTRTLRYGSYHGCEVVMESPGKLKIIKPKRWKGRGIEQVGDIIAIDCIHSPGGSIPHALSITDSTRVTLDSVSIYASAVFGFIENDCQNNTYRQCVVDRRPASTDLKKRASARIRSLNADAFHSYNAQKGPSYLGCRARFQGDDCIAINGEYHMVMEGAKTKRLRVLARRNFNMQVGDTVEILRYDGKRLPDSRVIAVKSTEAIRAEERDFLKKQRLHAGFQVGMHKAYLLTLDREVDLPRGSLLCSSNRLGNGFKIINGDFGFTRSRGLLIQASDGVIRGNTLDSCQGETIKVEPEFWWLSAGCSSNLDIRDNVIKNSKRAAISVSAKGSRGQISPAGAHHNITIAGNRIENSSRPQIHVTSTDGVNILNNTMDNVGTKSEADSIDLKKCQNIKMEAAKTIPRSTNLK